MTTFEELTSAIRNENRLHPPLRLPRLEPNETRTRRDGMIAARTNALIEAVQLTYAAEMTALREARIAFSDLHPLSDNSQISPTAELILNAIHQAEDATRFTPNTGLTCWNCETSSMHPEPAAWRGEDPTPRWRCTDCGLAAPNDIVLSHQPDGFTMPEPIPAAERIILPFQVGDRVRVIANDGAIRAIAVGPEAMGLSGVIDARHGTRNLIDGSPAEWYVNLDNQTQYYFYAEHLEHAR